MHADARQTQFCTYLSAILLIGLLLNAFFGLWWADPVAALIMVPIIAKKESTDWAAGPAPMAVAKINAIPDAGE